MKSRYEFGQLLTSMGLNGEAAEIGVALGDFSFRLLDTWPGRVHMIDPWAMQDQSVYLDSFNAGDVEQERRYQHVVARANGYGGRAIVHRMFSHEARDLFDDGQLCFVYIDANHRYEAIRDDLLVWYPKVQSGAVLAGHDFLDGELPSGSYGVKQAVSEMAERLGLEVNVIPDEWPSWWIIKP
jgi:hypothetical protein